MVWKNTKEIGAVSKVRKDGKTVVVVKYYPPGNVAGYFAKNVYPPRKPTIMTTPSDTTAGNATPRNVTTATQPNLYIRAAATSVKVWKWMEFAVQWLLIGFLMG